MHTFEPISSLPSSRLTFFSERDEMRENPVSIHSTSATLNKVGSGASPSTCCFFKAVTFSPTSSASDPSTSFDGCDEYTAEEVLTTSIDFESYTNIPSAPILRRQKVKKEKKIDTKQRHYQRLREYSATDKSLEGIRWR